MSKLIGLLLLPLRMATSLFLPLRIVKNLFFKLCALFMGPLFMLHRPVMFLLVAGVIGYFIMEALDDTPKRQQQTVDLSQPGAYTSTYIEPVTQTENGNSIHSADLIEQMNPDELAYYSHAFNWTMGNVEDAVELPWEQFNIGGTLTPTFSFESSTGTECRRFEEVLKVHSTQQTISGIACKDSKGGWCKLREDSTPNCDLGFASPWERTKMNMGTNFGRFMSGLF